jgi:transposase
MLHQRGKAYSQDLRERVFAASDGGSAVGVIAKTLMVSVSYVSKVLSRRRLTGETRARPQCCHVPPKLADYHEAIREHVKQKPDATIAELRSWLRQSHKVSVSTGVMHKVLIQLELTLKKRRSTRRNRTAPMLPPPGGTGVTGSPNWIPAG